MPSPRKRIGFLPSSEVQQLIDKICTHNKLSQSKVTGYLVEEALFYRGVLKTSTNNLSFDFEGPNDDSLITNNEFLDNDKFNYDKTLFNEEYHLNEDNFMIKEFIEYKIFKKIMNQNKRLSK